MTDWKCKYCNKEFETKNALRGHYGRCKAAAEWRDQNLPKSLLEDMYLIQKKSLPEIAEELGLVGWGQVYGAIKKHGIQLRNLSEASREPRRNDRYKSTCLEKYGATNTFSRESSSRKKWQERLFEEEGITNVFQRESVKLKSIESLMVNRGVRSAAFLPKTGVKYTKIHRLVVEELQKIGTELEIEKKIAITDRTSKFSNYYYSYDIWIKNTNKLIEVNGDFWHANPLVYKKDDIMVCGSWRPTAKEVWEKDARKLDFAKTNGYDVLVTWETDLKHNRPQEIERIIQWVRELSNENNHDQIN